MSNFAVASVRYLASDAFVRVCASLGCSQEDMDHFRGESVWTADLRVRMRRVLDNVVYGVCDLSMLPRVEVPAEMVAAVVACLVKPANWIVCAAMLEGLRSAHDLASPEIAVQIERLSSGRMVVLILQADVALSGAAEFSKLSSLIKSKLGAYNARAV